MQPLHITSTDSLVHFLNKPACTRAQSFIFNYQDGFVAFVCHGITGPELRCLSLWLIIFLFSRGYISTMVICGQQNNKKKNFHSLGLFPSHIHKTTAILGLRNDVDFDLHTSRGQLKKPDSPSARQRLFIYMFNKNYKHAPFNVNFEWICNSKIDSVQPDLESFLNRF